MKLHSRSHTTDEIIHHAPKGEKKHKCHLCDKKFLQPSSLKIHLRSHSGEKPYHCQLCGKSFSISCNLKRHLFTHSGEKPFECSICAKRFNVFTNLRTHFRLHTGEKPYKCQDCTKAFSDMSSLRKHRCSEKNFFQPLPPSVHVTVKTDEGGDGETDAEDDAIEDGVEIVGIMKDGVVQWVVQQDVLGQGNSTELMDDEDTTGVDIEQINHQGEHNEALTQEGSFLNGNIEGMSSRPTMATKRTLETKIVKIFRQKTVPVRVSEMVDQDSENEEENVQKPNLEGISLEGDADEFNNGRQQLPVSIIDLLKGNVQQAISSSHTDIMANDQQQETGERMVCIEGEATIDSSSNAMINNQHTNEGMVYIEGVSAQTG